MSSSSVEYFIAQYPKETQTLLKCLRKIIVENLIGGEEFFKYTVPFYTYCGLLCYISVTKKDIRLGFCRGRKMSNKQGVLQSFDRKEIRHYIIVDKSDIKETLILELLLEAMMLNELHHENKN